MTRFWQIFALIGLIIFFVILFSMMKTSNNTRDTVVAGTEQRFHGTTDSVIFTTNQGSFTVQLEKEKAPKTTTNFIKLATEGFYDGQRFHRIIEDFMIQGGDPLSKDQNMKPRWGTGGPGYTFADEFHSDLSNVTGTISMANAGPNTNGSQFFINVKDNTFLDGRHAVFGKVTSGMDIVMKISKLSTDQSDKPLEDVIVEKVEVK